MACKCPKAICRHITREYDRTMEAVAEANRAHDRLKKAFSGTKWARDYPGIPASNERLERVIKELRNKPKLK